MSDSLALFVAPHGPDFDFNCSCRGCLFGVPSCPCALEHGESGLGTFEGLHGEMIILDGEIYQAAGDVRRRSDDFLGPFASITHFREDASMK